MKRLFIGISGLIIAIAFVSSVKALSPFSGITVTSGVATQHVSGVFGVSASSTTPGSYVIQLNGPTSTVTVGTGVSISTITPSATSLAGTISASSATITNTLTANNVTVNSTLTSPSCIVTGSAVSASTITVSGSQPFVFTVSVATNTVAPGAAGILAIDSLHRLYISTGTAVGSWQKVSAQ